MEVKEWKGSEIVSINELIEKLNEFNKLDPEFIKNLISTRFKCNNGLANHKTTQVLLKDEDFIAGFLGILNGLLGIDKCSFGPVVAELDDNEFVVEFRLTDTKAINK